MTTVDHATGEIIEFDRAAAERRAQQIETRLTAVGESFTIAMQKIREAIELRDDIALGYRSPGDYVSARFGRALSGLPVEMRREAVRELTEAGMSTRAIASVAGVSHPTVIADRRLGGKSLPPTQPYGVSESVGRPATMSSAAELEDESYVREELHNRTLGITGIDGKTYPAPKKPRRTPLPDTAWRVAYDLRKKSESLTRVIEDDRFQSNKEQIAERIRYDLLLVQKAVAAALQELPEEN